MNSGRARIAERVEELALELLVKPELEPERWRGRLLDISEQAAAAGRPEVSRVACELADGLTRDAAEAGIIRLQQVLEGWAAAEAVGSAAWEAEPEPAPLAQDPELVNDFIVESREHLDSVEARLLEIERDPESMDAIHSVFRSFHTVKGLAGFLEFGQIRDVAHEVETVLDHVREGRLAMTPQVVDVVLASLDYLNSCLRQLEAAPGGASFPDPSALVARVRAAAEAPAEAPRAASEVAAAQDAPEPHKRSARTRSVKIDTEKLDYLVDMVGEMVIAQSLIRYDPDLHLDTQPRLARNLSQLSRITNDVQRTAMSMRMVPIGGLFQKMARLVRDLTRKFGKQAELVTTGDDVELDRNIVEELGDPLMHMIRNAVDHGIETPEERATAGKSATARIELRAAHQSGQISIVVTDDGRGLNREKILAKAQAQGLVEGGAELPDQEVLNLIFQPGFSTAEQLSQVSGRGVGMDVVRKQIQKLRGIIEIESAPGRGTTFTLRLPLTLAIIDGLVVQGGDHKYVIPIFAVREMLRPTADAVFTVENRSEMILIRERLVPVVRLCERFGYEPATRDPQQAVFVLAECDSRQFCLMVDAVMGKQEIVIKTLGTMFHRVPGVAGGAILGDGHVALILDLPAVFGGGMEA